MFLNRQSLAVFLLFAFLQVCGLNPVQAAEESVSEDEIDRPESADPKPERVSKLPRGTRPGSTHEGYNEELPTLWIIGDSTVKAGSDDGGMGMWGWGHELPGYFDLERINVENQALGGTSSRSFITYGYWDKVKALMREGDYLMLQFGHNDGGLSSEVPRIRARGSLKGTGEETGDSFDQHGNPQVVHTYGHYLRQYIREAQEMGVKPIVCSLIPRNDWVDGKLDQGQKEKYARWAREMAADEGAAFIDLNERAATVINRLGESFSTGTLYGPGDHTHTLLLGAQVNAACVARGVMDGGDSDVELDLKEYLNKTIQ